MGTEATVDDDIDKEKYMANLIDELSENFTCYAKLTEEILRRVDKDKVLCKSDYAEKENSVFDRVEQHKQNLDNRLDQFDQQFRDVHKVDHKIFTEQWLLEHTGKAYKLEKVIENPSFEDFVGVFDIMPRQAYVASKMIIDQSDFMGVFDLSGSSPSQLKRANTYEGVAAEHFDETDKAELAKHEEATADKKHELHEDSEERPESACCGSDTQVKPHYLGNGQYLQFRLRRENVAQYLDLKNSYTARKLNGLIPDDPKEPIYVFTASSNGVMRFHPWGGTARKLWHGYGDSASWVAFNKNIAHAAKYGCFCFGVIYKECENYKDDVTGKIRQGGRTIVMRYNRWATDNVPIYAMVRQKKGHENSELTDDDPRKLLSRQHKDPTGWENFWSCCTKKEKS